MRPSSFPTKITRAQAMVEFMLVLPFLLLLIYGTLEVGRLAFIFTSASNASRAAARYGAASGDNSEGTPYFRDCEGIREVANQSAYLSDFTDINITYDRGVKSDGTQIPISGVDPSPSSDSCPIEDIYVRNGDRIIVQVSTSYEPIVSVLPIDPLDIVSSSARTFIVSIPILGSSVPTGFFAETSTPSRKPTEPGGTHTPTATITTTNTYTPFPPDYTPFVPTATEVLPPTLTYTPSKTPLPSHTPTVTPTFIRCSGSVGVGHGPLRLTENIMEMTINNNTEHTLSTVQIYVEWNHDNGHQEGNTRSLHLRQITLGEQTWNGDLHAPSEYVPDFHPLIPPGESVIRFIFDQDYQIADGTERIIITLGTPGCTNYPVDSQH